MGKWIGIGLAVIGVIAIGFIVAAYIFPEFRIATRDIAIVILAVFEMISALLTASLLMGLLYTVFAIRRLTTETIVPKIDLLTTKLDAVIDSTQSVVGNVQETTSTVTTTTGYVAERVVAPVIRASSLLIGVRAAASFLARRGQK